MCVRGFAEPLPTTNPDSPSSEACAPLLYEISRPIMRPRVARHHARARAHALIIKQRTPAESLRLRLSVPNHFWDLGGSRFELSVRACCYCACARASVSRRRCDWACADVCVYIYTHIRTALIGAHTHTLCKRYHVFSCLTSRRNSKRD